MGKLKSSPELTLVKDYQKRLGSLLSIQEIKPSSKTQEGLCILESIPPGSYVIGLDERGENISSRVFADVLERAALSHGSATLIIGGAEGLDPKVREKSQKIISFGKLTWPHMLARVMATEQIYRAYSILSNHPYHRD